MKTLYGKTVLIANGTSEVATSIIKTCSENGAKTIVCTRNETKGKHFQCLNNSKTIETFVEKDCPMIDGLVICIGEVCLRPLKNVDDNFLKNQIYSHVEIAISLIIKLMTFHKLKKGVSVVFISSINGPSVASTGSCIYGMLKSAICGFSKGLSLELSSIGGRSNCICPGVIDTPSLRDNFSEQDVDNMSRLNLTRALVDLDDISEMVVFLLSSKSKSISGTNIIIDGGFCSV